MLQSELMDLWSVRMIRSVRTYTRDSLMLVSHLFAIVFANYLTRYLDLCQSPPRMKLSSVKTSGNPLCRKKKLLSSWALDKSVRMVYYHLSSVIFVIVWRCILRTFR
jgi:hypothetical protein